MLLGGKVQVMVVRPSGRNSSGASSTRGSNMADQVSAKTVVPLRISV
jgi:hypothetical protein